MKNKAIIIAGLILAAAGLGYYLYRKNKNATAAALPGSTTAATPAADTTVTPEMQAVNQLSSIIEADPIWQNKVFPSDFYQAVNDEYSDLVSGVKGRYNDGDPYKGTGIPGAFMGVADAWQSAMGFNDDTHTKLWQVYSSWTNDLAKSKLAAPATTPQPAVTT